MPSDSRDKGIEYYLPPMSREGLTDEWIVAYFKAWKAWSDRESPYLVALREIQQLRERVKALEDALVPFAHYADQADKYRHPEDSTCEWRLHARDLRKARALLAAKGEGR